MGELEFHAWLRSTSFGARDLVVGIGDDGAIVEAPPGFSTVLVADAMAEGSHFLTSDSPELIGRKALARNLSDIAAMGGIPRFALATAALPRGFAPDYPRRITTGMRALAAEYDTILTGGDTITHDGGLVISVTVIGFVERGRAVRRSGACVGDVIAVTGALGGSFPIRHLSFDPRIYEARELCALGPPSAMMDISDGLAMDLRRLAVASGVGFRVKADLVPLHSDLKEAPDAFHRALTDGEDYELLFTMSRAVWDHVKAAWTKSTPIRMIGEVILQGEELELAGGKIVPFPLGGHVHL